MARSWFRYTLSTPSDPEYKTASNYVAITTAQLSCPLPNPVNVCAIYATVSTTLPVITPNLTTYLDAAAAFPFAAQPTGLNIKRYVYTRAV